jgi:hypothetical protein
MEKTKVKLNRKYELLIQKQDKNGMPLDEAYIVKNPITIKFSVVRSVYSGVSNMTIDIYNLAPDTRNNMFKDWFYDVEKENLLWIALNASYEGHGMTCIFMGDIWNAYSMRQGTDIITRIQAVCGLRNMTQNVNITLSAQSTTEDVCNACMGDLKSLKKGKWSVTDYTFTEPIALMGKPLAILKQYNPDKNVFVDLDKVNILGQDEAFVGYVPLINDASGLLAAPERKASTLIIKMLFEPELLIGQVIEINSKYAPQFDGQYKIFGLRHEGIISDSIAGNCITTIELNVGSELYGNFKQV